MAHLVENMAFVGQTPWHGLGNELPAQQPIEVWAREAGMEWDIRETPVRFITGNAGTLGAIESFPDQKVLYRSDTHAPLSVVSQRYQVVQPRQILEFYRDLTEVSGFELETAGVLKGGRKLWALARTGYSTALKGRDVSRGYVLLATACDGTLATTAQFTNIRVVCNNTLSIALDNGDGVVKVPHSTKFDAEAMKRQLGISVSGWKAFMDRMKALSERKLKNTEVQRFLLEVFTSPHPASGGTNESAMAKALSLYEGRGKGAELPSAKGTAYGLLNAVTEFVDHERRARSPDYRLDSAWFGQGAAIKRKALEQALMLV
jgi:phage/plasmid-like protein (TIGR03299 family)